MDPARTALIIGASSGIGEALARQLSAEGWRLGLLARRLDRLKALSAELPNGAIVRAIDVAESEAAASILEHLIEELGGVDLVIANAGIGYLNPSLDWKPDCDTLRVNVLGFTAVAGVAMRHFLVRGSGHLVGVTSLAALRGLGDGAVYAASKAFQSIYLDGLRVVAGKSGLPIVVTEVQPGFVDTAMMKVDPPLPLILRKLLVASPAKAAKQILDAVERRANHAYITRRYGPIAFLMRRLPRPG